MTECICGYRNGSTKIAYMLHLRIAIIVFVVLVGHRMEDERGN